MRTILLLDSSDDWARIFRVAIEPTFEFLWVASPDMAKETIHNRRPLAAIIIGWTDGQPTLDFIRWLCETKFPGAIVAATPDSATNVLLVAAGCTMQVYRKDDTPRMVLNAIPSTR